MLVSQGYSIFIHTQARVIFGGFKILNFSILGGGGGGSDKINIFGGTKILWIFLGGHHNIGLYLGVISMHFRVFS